MTNVCFQTEPMIASQAPLQNYLQYSSWLYQLICLHTAKLTIRYILVICSFIIQEFSLTYFVMAILLCYMGDGDTKLEGKLLMGSHHSRIPELTAWSISLTKCFTLVYLYCNFCPNNYCPSGLLSKELYFQGDSYPIRF